MRFFCIIDRVDIGLLSILNRADDIGFLCIINLDSCYTDSCVLSTG